MDVKSKENTWPLIIMLIMSFNLDIESSPYAAQRNLLFIHRCGHWRWSWDLRDHWDRIYFRHCLFWMDSLGLQTSK